MRPFQLSIQPAYCISQICRCRSGHHQLHARLMQHHNLRNEPAAWYSMHAATDHRPRCSHAVTSVKVTQIYTTCSIASHCVAQHRTAQHNTAQHSAAQHSAAQTKSTWELDSVQKGFEVGVCRWAHPHAPGAAFPCTTFPRLCQSQSFAMTAMPLCKLTRSCKRCRYYYQTLPHRLLVSVHRCPGQKTLGRQDLPHCTKREPKG